MKIKIKEEVSKKDEVLTFSLQYKGSDISLVGENSDGLYQTIGVLDLKDDDNVQLHYVGNCFVSLGRH